jgi:hypothetical protein
MIYLYCWLGIGILIFGMILGGHYFEKKKESRSLHELLDALNPDRKKLSYRVLNHVVAPVLVAILIVIAWPVALYVKAKEIFPKGDGGNVVPSQEFAVERSDLQERLTVQEIERREMVSDPLNAVPTLPFGHLNCAWKQLLSSLAEESELWSFSVQWQAPWGQIEFRSGYVVVNSGLPGSYLMTVWKKLEDHT